MKALYCLTLVVSCGLLAGCGSSSYVPPGQGVGIAPMPDLQLGPPGGYPDTSLSSIPPPPPPEFFNPPPIQAEPAIPAPLIEAAPLAPAPLTSPY